MDALVGLLPAARSAAEGKADTASRNDRDKRRGHGCGAQPVAPHLVTSAYGRSTRTWRISPARKPWRSIAAAENGRFAIRAIGASTMDAQDEFTTRQEAEEAMFRRMESADTLANDLDVIKPGQGQGI